MSGRRILAMTRKEVIQIRRDPLSLMIIIAMPIIQLFIFGYAVNLDVKHIPLCVYDRDATQTSGTKNPTQARTNRPASRAVLWLVATLTIRLRRPCGARMAIITTVPASTSAFAIHGFMAKHLPFLTLLRRRQGWSVG